MTEENTNVHEQAAARTSKPGDRRVHAVGPDSEIVRYECAGKWYEEWFNGKRTPLTVKQAATIAVALSCSGGELRLGIPGGGRFEFEVSRA